MNKEKDKAKGGSMIGKIIFEVIKFLITAFIITNIVNIILMGALVPCFSKRNYRLSQKTRDQNDSLQGRAFRGPLLQYFP